MTPAKLNLFFSWYPYSGNGASASEHPSIRKWYSRVTRAICKDGRIGEVFEKDFVDTPITMTRNLAVRTAQAAGADVLVMVDSDQHPDCELLAGDKLAKPWWESSFDFLYQRRMHDLLTVVGAPYCGPPPHENVYIFRWATHQSLHAQPDLRIEAYSREEAAVRAGFEEVATLPTGLIMFDLRVFDLLEPPYFYYEYTDKYQSEKASTEDMTGTRDISMACSQRLGYNPLFVNWDAWAGHWKPKCVGKPRLIHVDQVSDKFAEAVRNNSRRAERLVMVDEGKNGTHRELAPSQ